MAKKPFILLSRWLFLIQGSKGGCVKPCFGFEVVWNDWRGRKNRPQKQAAKTSECSLSFVSGRGRGGIEKMDMFPELKRCSSVTNWGNKRSYLHLPLLPILLFSFAYVAQKMDAGQPEHDSME
jgi:hypothetical protein